MAEIEYSLQIINYLSFAPSGATANFTNVTVIGLNAGSGTFTTVEATNYDDLVGNPWLTIANGGQPTLQNTLNVNNHNLTNVATITATTGNFTTVKATYYDDYGGNNFITIPTGQNPQLAQTLNANANNITNCNDFNCAIASASSQIEAPNYCDILGNSFLTIGAGGQPTFTNTVAMGANPINFSTAAGASDQTLMTMGSSSTTRLVFQIGDNANDFNGKITFGSANSNIKDVPTTGLEIQSAGSFLQLNSALAVNGTGLTDTFGHIVYKSGTPSLATGPGCGTPIVAQVATGSDMSGLIQIETVSTGTASSVVATITFVNTWAPITPHVVLSPGSASTASLSGTAVVYISSISSTTFVMSVGSTALPAGTYAWYYVCLF